VGDLLGHLNIRYRRVVENAMTMRNFAFMLAGALIGTAFAMFMQKPPPVDLQIEFDAYRLCMQSASKTRCRMTPEDFVRYYQIKRILDAEKETPDQ
jgi:hypothetical protein